MTETGAQPVRLLLAEATAQLAAAGIDSARVDAELLLAELLDVPRSRLFTLTEMPAPIAAEFRRQVARRAEREPLQHITGHAPFRHLMLDVGPGVFVPRPETELLVDAVLPELAGRDRPLVVDLCAGSGALALAIASELPGAEVVAVERSHDAMPYLRRNAEDCGVHVVHGDVREPDLLDYWTAQADAVVSNPPYVPTSTIVAPEVRADPDEAVFAGPGGLELMPHVIARAAELLRDGGVFAVEHDDTQGETVPGLIWLDGRFTDVVDHLDLSGRPRFTTARRFTGHR